MPFVHIQNTVVYIHTQAKPFCDTIGLFCAKYKLMRNIVLLIMLTLPVSVSAQSSLYLSPGSTFHIANGSSISVDNLVLTPSENYTLYGGNLLHRSPTPLHTGSNPHISRVYQWNTILPPFTGTVSIYYNDSELNGIDENQLALNVFNGSNWNAYITGIIRNSTSNFVSTTLSGIALHELTLGTVADALPMVWLDVKAQNQNGVIQIRWQTGDEVNCDDYQVEKSSNGVDWIPIGHAIKAYNTVGPNNYFVDDNDLPAVISFYRIKQNDLDGRYSYSKIVSVKNDRQGGIWVYPVPADDRLNIVADVNQPLKTVRIYTSAGSLVAFAQPGNAVSYTMDVRHLAGGVYSVMIVLEDGRIVTRRVVKR